LLHVNPSPATREPVATYQAASGAINTCCRYSGRRYLSGCVWRNQYLLHANPSLPITSRSTAATSPDALDVLLAWMARQCCIGSIGRARYSQHATDLLLPLGCVGRTQRLLRSDRRYLTAAGLRYCTAAVDASRAPHKKDALTAAGLRYCTAAVDASRAPHKKDALTAAADASRALHKKGAPHAGCMLCTSSATPVLPL
jgi:hypothetical protein